MPTFVTRMSAEEVLAWRKEHNLTGQQAADLLSVNLSTWWRWEKGRKAPDDLPDRLKKLSLALIDMPPRAPLVEAVAPGELCRWREAHALPTQGAAADFVGVSAQHWGRWENGSSVPADIRNLLAEAEAVIAHNRAISARCKEIYRSGVPDRDAQIVSLKLNYVDNLKQWRARNEPALTDNLSEVEMLRARIAELQARALRDEAD